MGASLLGSYTYMLYYTFTLIRRSSAALIVISNYFRAIIHVVLSRRVVTLTVVIPRQPLCLLELTIHIAAILKTILKVIHSQVI